MGLTEAVLAVVSILILGVASTAWAWHYAGRASDVHSARASLVGGIGTSVITGIVVGFGVYYLQQQMESLSEQEAEQASWRANVATASEIPGFDSHGYKLRGLNLSGKDLTGADLRNINLRHIEMRGTDLDGADLTGADLTGAILYYADLSTADLTGADLRDAELQGARFDRALIESAKSLEGAVASPATCWPSGFLSTQLAEGLEAGNLDDGQGNSEAGRGKEWPKCDSG